MAVTLPHGAAAPASERPAVENETMRKVGLRLIPFLVLCYFISYVDRVDVGFAALTMNKDLGLSAAAFGIGGGLFFVAYVLLEVPSNLAMEKVGARLWIARIMITWGLVGIGSAFVTGAVSFSVARFLLGAAEAGFFPGVILYLTYWFPKAYRARIVAMFMVAIPLSSFFGSPLSAALLTLDGAARLAMAAHRGVDPRRPARPCGAGGAAEPARGGAVPDRRAENLAGGPPGGGAATRLRRPLRARLHLVRADQQIRLGVGDHLLRQFGHQQHAVAVDDADPEELRLGQHGNRLAEHDPVRHLLGFHDLLGPASRQERRAHLEHGSSSGADLAQPRVHAAHGVADCHAGAAVAGAARQLRHQGAVFALATETLPPAA